MLCARRSRTVCDVLARAAELNGVDERAEAHRAEALVRRRWRGIDSEQHDRLRCRWSTRVRVSYMVQRCACRLRRMLRAARAGGGGGWLRLCGRAEGAQPRRGSTR